jgi:hypothetical protein
MQLEGHGCLQFSTKISTHCGFCESALHCAVLAFALEQQLRTAMHEPTFQLPCQGLRCNASTLHVQHSLATPSTS